MRSVEVADLGRGVYRVTHPLPFALDHVHCYAVAGPDGWTVIDSGLGMGAEHRWRDALERLGRPHVRQVVLTHYHPDHVGGSSALARLTGAEEILQNARDRELAERSYTDEGNFPELGRYLRAQGMPPELASAGAKDERGLAFPTAVPTRLIGEGDTVSLGGDDFVALHLPGHADGHMALYDERSGRLFGGDVILERITPNVATWHDTEPDPLARYLSTLERLGRLSPAVVYPGHHRPLADAGGRAVEIREHHRVRLDGHTAALGGGAATPYEVSLAVWGDGLDRHERRFALVEAISHLVRLQRLGRAEEVAPGRWRAL